MFMFIRGTTVCFHAGEDLAQAAKEFAARWDLPEFDYVNTEGNVNLIDGSEVEVVLANEYMDFTLGGKIESCLFMEDSY